MKHQRTPVPDPDENPTAYREEDVLEQLYLDRGWPRREIAEHFDVSRETIDRHLRNHDIQRGDGRGSPPTTDSLARKLYEIGLEEAKQ